MTSKNVLNVGKEQKVKITPEFKCQLDETERRMSEPLGVHLNIDAEKMSRDYDVIDLHVKLELFFQHPERVEIRRLRLV